MAVIQLKLPRCEGHTTGGGRHVPSIQLIRKLQIEINSFQNMASSLIWMTKSIRRKENMVLFDLSIESCRLKIHTFVLCICFSVHPTKFCSCNVCLKFEEMSGSV